MDIAADPVTRDGKATTPITYDSNCLEEVCGSCAMLINGKARMACSALIDQLEQPIRLEPFSKFPVVRDLATDRSVIFENLKAVKAWVPIDGTYDLGAGPRMTAEDQEAAYPLSRCISCTCCMEACPQFNEDTGFVGAATIAQVRLFNTHPTGKALMRERLAALMAYANAGPGTNTSQFFITEVAFTGQQAGILNGNYTIFGQCDEASVALVKEIAAMSRDSNDRPYRPIKMNHITIQKGGAGAAKPATPAKKPAAATAPKPATTPK